MRALTLILTMTFSATILIGCSSMGTGPVTAESLFDRFVQVTYKGKGMGVHQSFTMKGTLFIDDFGIEAPVTIKQMDPNYLLFDTEVMGMDLSQGCNQKVCWNQQPGQNISLLDGKELATFRRFADFHVWENIEQYYETLEIVAQDASNNLAHTYKVRAVTGDGTVDFYYFSKDTGLLTGSQVTTATAMGEITQTTSFLEYKEFDGVLFASLQEQISPVATLRIVLDEITFNNVSKIDFATPN